MRKYLAEFIGTFFLVFTVGCSVQLSPAIAPLAIGLVLVAMVFAGGHISGGHFNPAVSLAAFLRGRLGLKDLAPYWGAQLLAGLVAALLVRFVVDKAPKTPPAFSGHTLGAALLVEFLFTFALAYVVLNVATSKDHEINSFYGLAIGITVLAGAIAVGSISGGAFNPAVALGISVMGLTAWANIWVYLVANLLGGAAAAYTFKALNPEDT